MSEDNSKGEFLKLREIINETLLRDVLLFVIFYLFILAQSWENFFLLLFPIISFGFSFFFRIINTNKYRLSLEIEGIHITYNPLGFEKKHANRLNFTALFQLILLFWIGAESLSRPQLLDVYEPFFYLSFIFFYTFGFYWILTDIWKYAKIAIRVKDENLVSVLKWRVYTLVTIINLINFIFINLLNLVSTILFVNNTILIVPLIAIWISPIIAIILLIIVYKNLNSISLSNLSNSIKEMSDEQRELIIQDFKKINKKLFQDLNNE